MSDLFDLNDFFHHEYANAMELNLEEASIEEQELPVLLTKIWETKQKEE